LFRGEFFFLNLLQAECRLEYLITPHEKYRSAQFFIIMILLIIFFLLNQKIFQRFFVSTTFLFSTIHTNPAFPQNSNFFLAFKTIIVLNPISDDPINEKISISKFLSIPCQTALSVTPKHFPPFP